MHTATQPDSLIERFKSRDRLALSKLISYIDDGGDTQRLFSQLPAPGATIRIALTGSAGVGKSTLIGALVKHLRTSGRSVGVLMCDPASPRTGGALLGDRVRIEEDPTDPDLFIRSISTRGAKGGISDSAGPIAQLMARFGFQVLLIETIGVGQDQVAARDIADVMVLVVTPQGGDEIQWQKAGVMECADIVAVNKADLGGAESVAMSVKQIAAIPVQPISAETDQGIDKLWTLIDNATRQPRWLSP